MSYDITAVERSFAIKCRAENRNLGQILEESPQEIPDFSPTSRKAIINFLVIEDKYVIETESHTGLVFKHQHTASVKVILTRNKLSFSSGFSGKWTILETTALITIEPDTEIMRFDFQDGEWG